MRATFWPSSKREIPLPRGSLRCALPRSKNIPSAGRLLVAGRVGGVPARASCAAQRRRTPKQAENDLSEPWTASEIKREQVHRWRAMERSPGPGRTSSTSRLPHRTDSTAASYNESPIALQGTLQQSIVEVDVDAAVSFAFLLDFADANVADFAG